MLGLLITSIGFKVVRRFGWKEAGLFMTVVEMMSFGTFLLLRHEIRP